MAKCAVVLDTDIALHQLEDDSTKQSVEFGLSLVIDGGCAHLESGVLPGIHFVSSMRNLPGFRSLSMQRFDSFGGRIGAARP
eukprot:SAG31_NODE_98_length_25640_cov_9.936744_25_plen_82_part_00